MVNRDAGTKAIPSPAVGVFLERNRAVGGAAERTAIRPVIDHESQHISVFTITAFYWKYSQVLNALSGIAAPHSAHMG